MPYKNIMFVKLEKRLFHDHRWFMMSENSQLNYVRFILFAAETYNKIPKDLGAIKLAFKTNQTVEEIERTVFEIQQHFPKFKTNKHFYYFEGFEEKTNYRHQSKPLEIPGKSSGTPGVSVYKEKEKDKDKEIYKEKSKRKTNPPISNQEFIQALKNNPAYKHINIDSELGKMDAWLLGRNREKTRRFVLNWLNRIEVPLEVREPQEERSVWKEL